MDQHLFRFVQTYPVRHFDRNETILLQDEESPHIFFVKEGFVKAYDIDEQGCEQLVWIGNKEDFFPLVWAFPLKQSSQLFYGAFTEVGAYAVPKRDFQRYLRNNPHGLWTFTKQLLARLNESFTHLRATKKAKSEQKIAHVLHYLSSRFGRVCKGRSLGSPRDIIIPITHQDIANLLGLTRETVAIELKRLKDQGFISYDKWHFRVYQRRLACLL